MTVPPRQPGFLPPLRALSLCALLACAPGAQAMTELVLQLDSSWRYDSNPFRFTNDANVAAAIGRERKGDSVLTSDVRGAVVVPLDSPQTRLILTGQLGRRNYDQLTQLDNTEYAYRAALEWRLGDLWRGELSHRDENQLFNYQNGGLTTREMVRATTELGEVALRVTPSLEVPFTLRSRRIQYETPVNAGYDSDERSMDLGVRYQATTQSGVRAGLRRTTLTYPQRSAAQASTLDTGFADTELYLDGDWQYSVMTRFSGRVAAQRRAYDNLGQKNFSVLTTDLRVLHDHSPLTRFTLELWNRPYGLTDPLTLYMITTGAQLGVRWQGTPKTRVNLSLAKEQQTYQYASLGPGQSNPKLDRTRLGGGVVYAWTPSVRVYVDGYRERLDRGILGAGIHQTFVRAGLEYTFENISGLAQRTGLGERR